MRTTNSPLDTDTLSRREFEAIADSIMYRWSAERDVWVSREEVEQARAYLARVGVNTSSLSDHRQTIGESTASTLAAAHLVMLGLRHLHAHRRGRLTL